MSNELAIAAVTSTLRNLLEKGINQVNEFIGIDPDFNAPLVTTLSPDKVRATSKEKNQVNLFLYHVTYDAALANMAMQGNQLKPHEAGFTPVPLVLHYLVTAYSQSDNSDHVSHKLLGKAMSVLHDHPLLGAAEISAMFTNQLDLSELSGQVERVRITRELLTIDEMSKLWTTFQTNYRISVGYQVSAVLIESKRPAATPLPVLTRGPDDSGIQSRPDLIPPYPTLTDMAGVNLPERMMPTALPGGTITLKGFHLNGSKVTAQFSHPRLPDPLSLVVPAADVTPEEVKVQIPANQPDKWPVGIYSVSLFIESGNVNEQDRTTNELAFALAPIICGIALPPKPPAQPFSVVRNPQNEATIELRCLPEVLTNQKVFLLLSDSQARQVRAEKRVDQTDPLVFIVKNAPVSGPEGFFIRLRIDGVDSLLITDYAAKPPVFDPQQKVIIT